MNTYPCVYTSIYLTPKNTNVGYLETKWGPILLNSRQDKCQNIRLWLKVFSCFWIVSEYIVILKRFAFTCFRCTPVETNSSLHSKMFTNDGAFLITPARKR